MQRPYLKLGALTALTIALAGCSSLKPTPYTEAEIKERVAADRVEMYADQEPVSGPISFSEAAARALKYNLDYRLKLMENALAQGLGDVASWDLLPRVLVGAGYSTRNNDSGGRSINIETREESLAPSTSQERNHSMANMEISWNLLDFGVSYYRAKQKADQYLMAKERERKVIQNVLQDTRNAYWRALGAQKLISRVDGLIDRVNDALARSRQAEQEGLLPQPVALGYQRALLDAVSLLSQRRQELELARAELAALMSLPPGTRFTLAEATIPQLPAAPTDIERLETMALERRPEIMEEWYRKRVTTNDIKAAMVLALPGIQLDFLNLQYDSNKYLYNNSWSESGIRVSWNLFRLASLPALQRAHDAQAKTDDYRRMALGMAVLTQVRIGVQRYALAKADLKLAEESARVDERLLQYAKAAATSRVDSELEVIRAEARQLLSQYQQYASYSSAQSAWGRLYNSVGLDVMPETIAGLEVKTLAQAIDKTTDEWERNTFDGQTLKVSVAGHDAASEVVAPRQPADEPKAVPVQPASRPTTVSWNYGNGAAK
ncbi:MAG TPA: TolC family protein [Burkholderiaceae bacterium]|nr:TolC family protein [Burkholderiaceae bacterium]